MLNRDSFRKWFASRRTPIRNSRKAAEQLQRTKPALETLEDRIAPAGTLSFAGTTLTFTAAAADTNNLTISFAAGKYTFTDTAATITAGAGTTQNGPNSAISNVGDTITSVIVTLSNNVDAVTVNSTKANTTVTGQGGSDTFSTNTAAVPTGSTLSLVESNVAGVPSFHVDAQSNPLTQKQGAAGPIQFQGAGDGAILLEPANGFTVGTANIPAGGLTAVFTMGGTASTGNTQTLVLSAPAAGTTGVNFDAGLRAFSLPTSDLASITVKQPNSNTDSDAVTVDFTNGDPLPASGLSYTGGNGTSNTLTVQGGPFTTDTYTPSGAQSGTVQLNGVGPVTFASLSAVTDTTSATSFTASGTSASEQINIVNGPAGETQINSGTSGTFELVNFANKTNVTVNTLAGPDVVTLNNPSPAVGLSTLTVSGGNSGNTYNVTSIGASITTTVDGGGGNDTFNISDGGLGANSSTTLDGQAGDDTFNVSGSLTGGAILHDNGNAPAFPANPGDTLNVPAGSVVLSNGPGSGVVTGEVSTYASIENVAGGPYTLTISTNRIGVGGDGTPDTVGLVLTNSGSTVAVTVDGTLEAPSTTPRSPPSMSRARPTTTPSSSTTPTG